MRVDEHREHALELLPRLPKGVFVHFHDVTIPYDYMPDLLSGDLFFWTESVLVHAFLIDHPRFEIRLDARWCTVRPLSEREKSCRRIALR
jgi:hypothetical protein